MCKRPYVVLNNGMILFWPTLVCLYSHTTYYQIFSDATYHMWIE